MSAAAVARLMVRDGKSPRAHQVYQWAGAGVSIITPSGAKVLVRLGYTHLPAGMSFTPEDVDQFISQMTAAKLGVGQYVGIAPKAGAGGAGAGVKRQAVGPAYPPRSITRSDAGVRAGVK